MGYVCLIGAMLGITGMYVFMKLFSGSVKNGLCVSLGFTVVFSIVATIACAIIGPLSRHIAPPRSFPSVRSYTPYLPLRAH